jgi:hypothetical protein
MYSHHSFTVPLSETPKCKCKFTKDLRKQYMRFGNGIPGKLVSAANKGTLDTVVHLETTKNRSILEV